MVTKIVRVVLIVILVVVVAFAIWTKTTRQGRDVLQRMQIALHGGQAGDDDEDKPRGDGALDPQKLAEAADAAEKLKALHVQMGGLPPDPAYISLDCTGQKLGDEGFRLIGKCVQIRSVGLYRTDANDARVKNLANLTRLESLAITDSPEVGDAGIQCVAAMPGLTGLTLTGTGVGDKGLKTIGRLPELATLSLARTRVADAGMSALAGLKKLQWLVLIDTAVTDDGIAKLGRLSSLRQLSVRGTKVTDAGKERLRKMNPNLKIE